MQTSELLKSQISSDQLGSMIQRLPQFDRREVISFETSHESLDSLSDEFFVEFDLTVDVHRGSEKATYSRPAGGWVESSVISVYDLMICDENSEVVELTPEQHKKFELAIIGRVEI